MTASSDDAQFEIACDFLKQMRTSSLATVDEQCLPHAANIQYVWTATNRLCFLSSEQSNHARHIQQQPRVALSVYDHDDRPHMIRGVQLHGRCEAITEPISHAVIMKQYAMQYPIVNTAAFIPILARQTLFEVTPLWLRWIDNRTRFGFKVEWSLDV